MSTLKKCTFYRDAESLGIGTGLGHCDLLGHAICEGDVKFCENPRKLLNELSEQRKKELKKAKEEGNQGKKPSNYSILVVDDTEALRKLVVAFLSKQGHQCATAGNGVEALSKIHKDKFDAVITDIVMPEMDGIALTKELLSLYPKIPIMVMTGYSEKYPAESVFTAGARDFIGKPFSYNEFVLRFNKMMTDHEISLEIESKQREILVDIQKQSSDKINGLQREIETLKNRLSDKE